MSWQYDSGGHVKDQKKYAENFEKIPPSFPCEHCGGTRRTGHTDKCPYHWKNKK